MHPALRLLNVKKCFGRQEVIRDLSLCIDTGEFVGLVGVNGAGKTTLLKCLLDFCDLDRGAIEIFGIRHTHSRARARLAYLPERFAPPSFATGREFLQHMAKLHGQGREPAKIEDILSVLDLDGDSLAKPVRQLSRGMAQKLGLAATLSSGKDLLLLDEPMSGLDPKARTLLKHHLTQQKPTGRTLFFTTHLLSDLSALCDRLAILHGGELRYVGTVAECCARYGCQDLEEAYLHCVTS